MPEVALEEATPRVVVEMQEVTRPSWSHPTRYFDGCLIDEMTIETKEGGRGILVGLKIRPLSDKSREYRQGIER